MELSWAPGEALIHPASHTHAGLGDSRPVAGLWGGRPGAAVLLCTWVREEANCGKGPLLIRFSPRK